MKKNKSKKDVFEILPKEIVNKFFKERLELPDKEFIANGVEYIDKKLEELEELIGRDLKEFEESAILDIVDELTPKRADGKYIVDLLPFDYAWEIYKARLSTILSVDIES
ncbi:MAG: hypothetical protein WCO55_00410 [Candidatus Falkowbacteria bacterium]